MILFLKSDFISHDRITNLFQIILQEQSKDEKFSKNLHQSSSQTKHRSRHSCFKGIRVAVKTWFDYLEEESLEDFLKGFPSVSREQAEAVIELTNKH